MNISIIDLIPKGKENAIKRNVLIDLCIFHDLIGETKSRDAAYREVRKLLSKARLDYPILNNSDGKGYYRPTKEDYAELRKYISQEESRAMNTFTTLKTARQIANDYLYERLEE